jgi:hypothetical protein
MIEQMVPDMKAFRQSWSRTVTSLVWGQWIMLDSGLRAAQAIFQAASAAPGAAPPRRSRADDLVSRAMERLRLGLAPPREIYQSPYRNQIDWSQVPEWARPSDPEMFEGSGHEG